MFSKLPGAGTESSESQMPTNSTTLNEEGELCASMFTHAHAHTYIFYQSSSQSICLYLASSPLLCSSSIYLTVLIFFEMRKIGLGPTYSYTRRVFVEKWLEAKCRENHWKKSGIKPAAPSRSEALRFFWLSQIDWGFGWFDKAQCFRSARWIGAACSSPDYYE